MDKENNSDSDSSIQNKRKQIRIAKKTIRKIDQGIHKNKVNDKLDAQLSNLHKTIRERRKQRKQTDPKTIKKHKEEAKKRQAKRIKATEHDIVDGIHSNSFNLSAHQKHEKMVKDISKKTKDNCYYNKRHHNNNGFEPHDDFDR